MDAVPAHRVASGSSVDVAPPPPPQLTKEAFKEAIKEAAKEQETEKKDKEKKEKTETGIKPRDLILPALVVLVLAIPIVAIFLPVFISAGQLYDKGKTTILYTCAIGEANAKVTAAWKKSEATSGNSNGVFLSRATKAKRPVLNATEIGWLNSYSANQQCACNYIASQAFGDPQQGGQCYASSEDVKIMYDQFVGTQNMTYAERVADSPDEDWYAYAYDLAYAFDYYDYDGESTDVNGSGTGGGQRRKLLTIPKLNASEKEAIFKSINKRRTFERTVTGTSLTTNYTLQGVAGYTRMSVALSAMDPLIGVASFTVTVTPSSINSYPDGIMDRKKVSLSLPKGVALTTLVTTAEGAAGGLFRMSGGDSLAAKKVEIATVTTKSIYFYPFDSYQATFEAETMLGFNETWWKMAMLVRQRNLAVGWEMTITRNPDPTENIIEPANFPNSEGAGKVSFTVTLKRTTFVQFFAVLVLIFMWLLASFACLYGIDGLFLRRRPMAIGDATLFSGLLFSFNGIRSVMPNVPPVGVGVDFFGYIWIIIMMMGTSAMVYCRVVGQFVHKEPTLYDRFFNKQYYDEWTAEQAEKKKKDEEKKRKEEEAKKAKDAEKKVQDVQITVDAKYSVQAAPAAATPAASASALSLVPASPEVAAGVAAAIAAAAAVAPQAPAALPNSNGAPQQR